MSNGLEVEKSSFIKKIILNFKIKHVTQLIILFHLLINLKVKIKFILHIIILIHIQDLINFYTQYQIIL